MEPLGPLDDECEKCHSSKLLSPTMKLLVSSCCHKMYGQVHAPGRGSQCPRLT